MCAISIQQRFFRPCCRLCRAATPAGQSLCHRCLSALPHLTHACPRCALPLDDRVPPHQLCGECLADPPPFDRVIAPFIYRDPIDDLIGRFKYHRALSDGQLLARLLALHIQRIGHDVELLLPMPLHPTRLQERGYNQAAEVTRVVSKVAGAPWHANLLLRQQAATSQREANKRERLRNVRSAFGCASRHLPGRVAIIDDVITTGATARAAAACLKKAGVNWVEIWAVARTPRPGAE